MTAAPALGTIVPKPPSLRLVRPTWLLPWLGIEPGTEYRTLVRFAGWAFATGHDGPSALARGLTVNREWGCPLTSGEVYRVIYRVAALDAPRAFRAGRAR